MVRRFEADRARAFADLKVLVERAKAAGKLRVDLTTAAAAGDDFSGAYGLGIDDRRAGLRFATGFHLS